MRTPISLCKCVALSASIVGYAFICIEHRSAKVGLHVNQLGWLQPHITGFASNTIGNWKLQNGIQRLDESSSA